MIQKGQNGSAYILVLIVMLILFLTLTATLATTRYEARVSDVYAASANMRMLANSSAEQAVFLLNGYLAAADDETIEEEAENRVSAINKAVNETMGASGSQASYTVQSSASEDGYEVRIAIQPVLDGYLNIMAFDVAVNVVRADYGIKAKGTAGLDDTCSFYEMKKWKITPEE